jgi:hypothetical protein
MGQRIGYCYCKQLDISPIHGTTFLRDQTRQGQPSQSSSATCQSRPAYVKSRADRGAGWRTRLVKRIRERLRTCRGTDG